MSPRFRRKPAGRIDLGALWAFCALGTAFPQKQTYAFLGRFLFHGTGDEAWQRGAGHDLSIL
jgi:hypothetical protein